MHQPIMQWLPPLPHARLPPRPMAQNRVFFQLSCVLPNENGIRIWNSTWNSRMEYIKIWNIIVHDRIANGIHPLFQVKCRLFQVSAPYSRSTTMRYSRILHGIAFVFHSNSFAVHLSKSCFKVHHAAYSYAAALCISQKYLSPFAATP